jgi:hypothetical protein
MLNMESKGPAFENRKAWMPVQADESNSTSEGCSDPIFSSLPSPSPTWPVAPPRSSYGPPLT